MTHQANTVTSTLVSRLMNIVTCFLLGPVLVANPPLNRAGYCSESSTGRVYHTSVVQEGLSY